MPTALSAMQTVSTRFFGDLQIQRSQILRTVFPIQGFERDKEWILLPSRPDSPWLVLQSMHHAERTFIVCDPLCFFPNYQPDPTIAGPVCGPPKDWATFVICTFLPSAPPTANLRSPLIFNVQSRRGGQFLHPRWPESDDRRRLPQGQEP